jgi:hypothetical protein
MKRRWRKAQADRTKVWLKRALILKRDGKLISIARLTVSADGKTAKWIVDDKLQGTPTKGAAQKQ